MSTNSTSTPLQQSQPAIALIRAARRGNAARAAAEIHRQLEIVDQAITSAAKVIGGILDNTPDDADKTRKLPRAAIIAALGSRAAAVQAVFDQYGVPAAPQTPPAASTPAPQSSVAQPVQNS